MHLLFFLHMRTGAPAPVGPRPCRCFHRCPGWLRGNVSFQLEGAKKVVGPMDRMQRTLFPQGFPIVHPMGKQDFAAAKQPKANVSSVLSRMPASVCKPGVSERTRLAASSGGWTHGPSRVRFANRQRQYHGVNYWACAFTQHDCIHHHVESS
jgi:hypothetical protein